MNDYEYYDWECTACGKKVCCATTKDNPETYINRYGKHTYACRNGYKAKWIQVHTNYRDMNLVRAMFS